MAAAGGDAELVELLLNSGANVNLQSMDERTPLDIAVDGMQQGVVRLLLDRKRRMVEEDVLPRKLQRKM
jgi:ankyrin repeat protein